MGMVGLSFSTEGVGSKIACSGTVEELRFGIGRPGVERRSFRGVSPRSILEVLNLTLPDGEWGGVMTSSGSSGTARVGKAGSDTGAAEEVSLSPDWDVTSS